MKLKSSETIRAVICHAFFLSEESTCCKACCSEASRSNANSRERLTSFNRMRMAIMKTRACEPRRMRHRVGIRRSHANRSFTSDFICMPLSRAVMKQKSNTLFSNKTFYDHHKQRKLFSCRKQPSGCSRCACSSR